MDCRGAAGLVFARAFVVNDPVGDGGCQDHGGEGIDVFGRGCLVIQDDDFPRDGDEGGGQHQFSVQGVLFEIDDDVVKNFDGDKYGNKCAQDGQNAFHMQ